MSNYVKLECRANTENEMMVRYMIGFFLSPINPTINELTEIKTIIWEYQEQLYANYLKTSR